MNYNLAIIGAGPAGYTAADKAASAGLSVILFEKEQIGGVCLNWGCIPTKTLLYSAKTYDHIRHASRYGITTGDYSLDLPKVIARKNKIIRKLNVGIRSSLKNHGVTVVSGEAHITDTAGGVFSITCGEETYHATQLLLATGSDTFIPPIEGLKEIPYWTNREALDCKEAPASLVIVGGGVIGMEFAAFFNSLGTKVTVVEMLDEILGGMDREIAALLREEYRKRGIDFYLNARVTRVETGKISFEYEGETQVCEFDNLLMAAGRRPVITTELLNSLPLKFEGRFLQVNDRMQTSVPQVYACGDITGRSMLAHTAEREAEVAVNVMLGKEDAMRYNAIPGVVYTSPEVAAVGATEEELVKANIPYSVRKLPMTYSGRFVVENEGGNGLCKILTGSANEILGVHIIGSPASEFIIAAGMAIQHGLTVEEWEKSVFPHPTVSEILKLTLADNESL